MVCRKSDGAAEKPARSLQLFPSLDVWRLYAVALHLSQWIFTVCIVCGSSHVSCSQCGLSTEARAGALPQWVPSSPSLAFLFLFHILPPIFIFPEKWIVHMAYCLVIWRKPNDQTSPAQVWVLCSFGFVCPINTICLYFIIHFYENIDNRFIWFVIFLLVFINSPGKFHCFTCIFIKKLVYLHIPCLFGGILYILFICYFLFV